MRTLCFYFLIALYLYAHVADGDVSFDMNGGATSETYEKFIKDLRTALTVNLSTAYDIPILQSTATGSARFVLANLNSYQKNSIIIAIDLVNAYVVAYRAGSTMYVLSDVTSAEERESLQKNFNGIHLDSFKFKGSYSALETVAGTIREKIDLGFTEISSSIDNMFHNKDMKLVAKGFIVIIQTVSVAARFQYIEETVSIHGAAKFQPNPQIRSYENRWSDLSEQIQIAQTRNGKFARNITVQDYNNKDVVVSDVSSDVVKQMKLLLKSRIRVAEPNIVTQILTPEVMNFLL